MDLPTWTPLCSISTESGKELATSSTSSCPSLIRNNTLVSASCAGSPNFVPTSIPVTNGHFSMTANGNSFSGGIDAQGTATANLYGGTSLCSGGAHGLPLGGSRPCVRIGARTALTSTMRSIQTRRLLPVLSATRAVALVVYGCGGGVPPLGFGDRGVPEQRGIGRSAESDHQWNRVQSRRDRHHEWCRHQHGVRPNHCYRRNHSRPCRRCRRRRRDQSGRPARERDRRLHLCVRSSSGSAFDFTRCWVDGRWSRARSIRAPALRM